MAKCVDQIEEEIGMYDKHLLSSAPMEQVLLAILSPCWFMSRLGKGLLPKKTFVLPYASSQ